jgi:hypothetical protein
VNDVSPTPVAAVATGVLTNVVLYPKNDGTANIL